MNPFTSPRARRPVNARVIAVSPPAASARRCGSLVPASGQSRNAVPICAAAAPAASAACTPSRSAIPPVATSGNSTFAAIARTSSSRGRRRRPCRSSCRGGRQPRRPGRRARRHPPPAAARASSTLVTVSHDSAPAARTRSRSSRVGTAEGERDDRCAGGERDREFRVEGVVVESRLTELDAPTLRLGLQLVGVGSDRARVDRNVAQDEQVDAERLVGQRPRPLELFGKRGRRQIARTEERQTAGVRDGRRELGRRRAARERREHDRLVRQHAHRASRPSTSPNSACRAVAWAKPRTFQNGATPGLAARGCHRSS